MSVSDPPPVVLRVPAVKEIPWHAPTVPRAEAVIAIGDEVPDVVKFAIDAKPFPPLPFPLIVLVAVMVPALLKAAATFRPLPPVAPAIHEEKVKSPVVNEVHEPLIVTPCEATAPLPPVPLILIGPVALVIVVAILTPALALLLGPPVPINVMVPLVVVLRVPPVREIPWHIPSVPRLLAVIWRALADVEEVEKSFDAKKPIPPFPCPSMELVAVISPVVVKAATTLIPLPPIVELLPPIQLENRTLPLPVKEVCKSTP